MARTADNLITIVGPAYFQPVADLIDRWLTIAKRNRPNRVQSGYYEHGYASSVVLLLVAAFESYVARVRYIQGSKIPASSRSALDVVRTLYPKLRHMKALEDVYVLRDSLAHNYLWVVDYEYGGSPSMVMRSASKSAAYGNHARFRDRVNMATHKTKALGLHVLPSRVDRRDALRVFQVLWKTLERFEKTSIQQCSIRNERVRFSGKTVLVSQLEVILANAL
jgi:hypothetical protein